VLGSLTAIDVVLLLLGIGLVAALFGYAGGTGARIRDRIRLASLEDAFAGLAGVVNRYKGAAGQAVAKQQREKLTKREQEAEELALKLQRGRGGGLFPQRPLSEQDAEEQALAQLEREAEQKGLKIGGKK
jgi:hypothetical protein